MEKTKRSLSITIDKKIYDLIDKHISNRSRYIEWLIFEDLKKWNSRKTDGLNL